MFKTGNIKKFEWNPTLNDKTVILVHEKEIQDQLPAL